MTLFTLSRWAVLGLLALASGCSASAADSEPTQQMSGNVGGSSNGNGNAANGSGAGSTSAAGSVSGSAGALNAGGTGGDRGDVTDDPGPEQDAGSAVSVCYSPTQNTDTAYDEGAVGCPCDDATDEDVCVDGVALICEQGFWRAVEDGPCQPMFDPCAPQDVMMVGGCEPAPVYFWTGTECVGQSGCSCEGADCEAVFPSQEECEASYASCGGGQGCGGFLGNTCSETEYCAYEPGQLCGAADASSTCMPRPMGCTKELNPVCGCDGMTYGNACEANAAGSGILGLGECGSDN